MEPDDTIKDCATEVKADPTQQCFATVGYYDRPLTELDKFQASLELVRLGSAALIPTALYDAATERLLKALK